MKKYIGSFVMMIFIAGQVMASDANSKKGFFLGLGLGGGGVSDLDGGFNKGAFLGNFMIGGGISDRLLLMSESSSAVIKEGNIDLTLSSWNFSSAFFVTDQWYVRPGIGFAQGKASATSNNVTFSSNSSYGLSVVGSTGYEFRLGKGFALSPEINLAYARIEGANLAKYGAQVGVLYYF